MRHSPTRTNTIGLCFGAGLAAIALAGCSSAGTTSAAAQSTATAAAAGGTTTTAASGATGSTAASSTNGGSGGGSSQTGSSTNSDACTTSDLSLQVFEGPQDGSGKIGVYIVLANTSHSTCTTYGYPGVDFYLGTTDLHEQTTRTTGSGSATTVTLPPGGQATSYFTYPSGPVCDAAADTVQVIPPNQTTALRASIDYVGGTSGSKQFDVCDGNIDVGPFQAGYDGPH